MNETLNKLLIEIIIAVLPILTVFFTRYLNIKTKQLKDYLNNKQLDNYIDIAEDLINKTVIEVNQSFVETLKNTGKFDKQAQEEAFKKAKQKIMLNLTEQSKNAIRLLYADVNSYIDRQIQFAVNKNK